MHGWGSRGGRLAGFVEPLLEAGYRVVTHDAPGHGSSYGRLSSLPQFAAAMLAVAQRFGPAAGVIAHSMGGSATTLAMARGFTVSRAVFIAPAANPPAWVEPFAGLLGLSGATVDRLRGRGERR